MHAMTSDSAEIVWLPLARRSLRGLGLPPEWPEESVEAPGERASRLADYALRLLAEMGLRPQRLLPSLEGGVCIAFDRPDRPGRWADVQFLNGGEVIATCSSPRGSGVRSWLVEPGDAGLRLTFDAIHEFLAG